VTANQAPDGSGVSTSAATTIAVTQATPRA
jgi:galactokinase